MRPSNEVTALSILHGPDGYTISNIIARGNILLAGYTNQVNDRNTQLYAVPCMKNMQNSAV
jgi:hypothetical protein